MHPHDRPPPPPDHAGGPVPPVPLTPPSGPPAPPPVPQRRPRSAGAAIACLCVWSLLAPVAVLVVGALAYLGIVVATFALVVITFGAIAAEPEGEAWIDDRLGAGDYGTWMGHVTPVAWASLVVTLALGGLALVLLRRTQAVTWHPLLQGTLSAACAVAFLVVGAGLVGLVV